MIKVSGKVIKVVEKPFKKSDGKLFEVFVASGDEMDAAHKITVFSDVFSGDFAVGKTIAVPVRVSVQDGYLNIVCIADLAIQAL